MQVWYTQRNSVVYATMLGWPASAETITLVTPTSQGPTTTQVSMLGLTTKLQWTVGPGGKGMTITLPSLPPADDLAKMPAWTLALINVA